MPTELTWLYNAMMHWWCRDGREKSSSLQVRHDAGGLPSKIDTQAATHGLSHLCSRREHHTIMTTLCEYAVSGYTCQVRRGRPLLSVHRKCQGQTEDEDGVAPFHFNALLLSVALC